MTISAELAQTPWMQALLAVLPAKAITTEADALEHYGRDWTRVVAPAPIAVVLPSTTAQVVSICKIANEHRLAVVPSGGRTGLSGGAMAANGELVIALDRMNQIIGLSKIDQQMHVQAGVVTADIQARAKEHKLCYPVDFASSGSSQIGGNIATNAGGIQVIRYGMTRQWVLGLTVVLMNGDVIEANQGLYKNATGYDWRHLFIGSEGTLGIIVEARLQLCPLPANTRVLVLGVAHMQALIEVMTEFRDHFTLNAFEFFSQNALDCVCAHRELKPPLDSPCPLYALIEIDQGTQEEAAFDVLLLATFEHLVETELVLDGVISQSVQQAQDLWALREGISESIAPMTPYKNDIAVVPSKVPAMLAEIEALVANAYPNWQVLWFGHIGDGNLHLNILKPADLSKAEFVARCHQVTHQVSAIVQSMQGTISAEHGVGLLKRDYLRYVRSPEDIALMRAVKQVFDPNGLLNPGKIFEAEQ